MYNQYNMSVKVTDNTNNVVNTINAKANIFLRTFADVVLKTSQPKTPKRGGFLRRDVLRQVLGLKGKIEWRKSYAAKMETRQFRHYTTPGTGPHYAENAIKDSISKSRTIAKSVGLI